MILIHRFTPFFILCSAASGFAAVVVSALPVLPGLALTVAMVAFLFARLCRLSPRSFQFWYLTGTPVTFLLSSFGFLLLLERPLERWALAAATSLLLFLFAELVFAYVHVPATYRAYSIEHLSLGLNVLTTFFLSSFAFGTGMLLQLPLWLSSAAFASSVAFIMFGTLWVSKVAVRPALAYALAGTALATELFAVISYLPTGYYVDAALISVFLYVFLGLTRARFLDKMTKTVVGRYSAVGSGLFLLLMGTARWT
ncbi:hypothetical protein EPO34_04180 [Patescibacteria group bacterium]|nr:MAG: hypothetical protein EPO34_04180 [Patescibacteria group bacterium]